MPVRRLVALATALAPIAADPSSFLSPLAPIEFLLDDSWHGGTKQVHFVLEGGSEGDAVAVAVPACLALVPRWASGCVFDILEHVRRERALGLIDEARRIAAAADKARAWALGGGGTGQAVADAAAAAAAAAALLVRHLEFDIVGANTAPLELLDGGDIGLFARSPATALWPAFSIAVHRPVECRYLSEGLLRFGLYDPLKSAHLAALFRARMAAAAAAESAAAAAGGNSTLVLAPPLFMDVGAHVGYFSLLAAACGTSVLAVEPLAYNRDRLAASLRLPANAHLPGLVVVAPVAAGRREDPAGACLAPSEMTGVANRGNAKVVPSDAGSDGIESATGGDGGGGSLHDGGCERVAVRTVDGLLADAQVRQRLGGSTAYTAGVAVDVLKVDVEGFELDVLLGAGLLLADPNTKPCVIIAEHLPDTIASDNNDGSGDAVGGGGGGGGVVFELLRANGYGTASHEAGLPLGAEGDYHFTLDAAEEGAWARCAWVLESRLPW